MGKDSNIRLKNALKINHYAQKDFAEIVGMSEKHISQLVNGVRNLTPQNAEKFSSVLNVRSQWLLSLDDFMTEKELQECLTFVEGWDSADMGDIVDKLLQVQGFSMVALKSEEYLIDGEGEEQAFTKYSVGVYSGTKKLCELSDFEHEQLIEEVSDYAVFVLQRLLKQKGTNDGE